MVFVKNPELGKAKTRLAKSVGDKEALHIYKRLLSYTRGVLAAVDAQKEVWYSSFVGKDDEWDSSKYNKKLQTEGNLGEKMFAAFKEGASLSFDKMVLIGSDCAELGKEHLQKAFDQLGSNDVVIGPAKDGGYYLIGMRKPHQELFEGIAWSTGSVLEQTMEKAQSLSLNVFLLDPLSDVDELEDWKKVEHRVPLL
jgi:hypothetical protein